MARLSDDLRGGLWMILGGLCFTIVGVVIKTLGSELPPTVIVLFRHIFALLCFVPIVLREGATLIYTKRYFEHFYRGVFGFLSFYGLVYALPRLNLADVTALTFTAPLWSLMLSVLFLGEPIRPSRWLATAVGFGGMLMIAKPSGQIDWAMVAALGAALFTSLAMMKVKQLSATEPPDRIAFYFLLNGVLLGAPLAAPGWRTPDVRQLIWLAGIGAISFVGQICLSRGYALGQFTKMAPMDFFRLPLAILLGFLMFAELPDTLALVGMAIVVAASLFILLARSPSQASTAAAATER